MIDVGPVAPPEVRRLSRIALIVGVVGLVLCAVGWLLSPNLFFRAYLFAYVYWSGIAVGCLGILLLQYLTGGIWGLLIRRILEAAARTIPLVAVLAVPLAFGLPNLYPWARPEVVAADPTLAGKTGYLNVPFFLIRAIFYLGCWVVIAYLAGRWSDEQDRTADPGLRQKFWRLSCVGLIVLGLTVSFAAIDWTMSLEPDWYSTVYPALVSMGHILAAFSFTILVVYLLSRRHLLAGIATPVRFNDLGSLLLAWVMFWAYLGFSQLLLTWTGNLREEIPFYLRRTADGWVWLARALMVFEFAVPFGALVFRPLKRTPWALTLVAVLLLVIRLVEVFWLVIPALAPAGFTIDWVDVVAAIGLGGVWLGAFAHYLATRPLLPRNDPRLLDALESEREPA